MFILKSLKLSVWICLYLYFGQAVEKDASIQ